MFKKKPLLYLQLLDQSLRYMTVHPKTHEVIEKDEILFDSAVLEEGKIVNSSLLETRLNILIREKKWKKAKTYILLMKDFITVRKETVPGQLSQAEIKDYLNLHMNQTIRMPFENPVFDFEVVKKDGEKQEIVLLAYPREYVDQYEKLLEKVNLKPEVADIATLNLYHLAEIQGDIQPAKDKHTMVLQWNPYNTNVMVFHEGLPTFNRFTASQRLADSWALQTSGEWEWKLTEEELDFSLEEQLDALGRFLDFYRYSVLDGDNQVSDVVLTGYYPNLEDLRERLLERFDLQVNLLSLPEGIEQRFAGLYSFTLKDKGGRSR